MEKIQKSPITLIAIMLLAGLLVLSACGPEAATPTPVQAPTATTPAQSGLEADATLIPLPTRPFATPTSADIPGSIETAIAQETPTKEVEAQIVADLGFRPQPDGFSFENYAGTTRNGKAVPELFVDDIIKMFGEADVCIKVENGVCTPKQEALDWLEEMNSEPPGGHCEGMAVASLLLFKELDSPSNYDEGAETTYDLKLTDPVRRLITYYYYLQSIEPVMTEYWEAQQLPPSEVLDSVIASMQDGAPDPVNLGFYGGEPDEYGYLPGHSITPYSVEDQGNGIFRIYVYDNNWPDNSVIYMEIDRVNETWSYDFSAQNPEYEPDIWSGDAESRTLAALPLSWRTGTLFCPWCDYTVEGASEGVVGSALKAISPGLSLVNSGVQSSPESTSQRSSPMQISLNGDGSLLIVNSKGQRLGYDGTKLVQEIPGAKISRPRTGKGAMQPTYYVPKGDSYSISLNGHAVAAGVKGNSNVSIFGQGMAISVRDLELNTGDQHKLTISADAQNLGFVAGNSTAKPTFRISTTVNSGPGVLSGATSYQFQVGNVDLTLGQQVDFSLSKPTGQFDFKSTGSAATTSSYDLDIVRTDTAGTQAFKKLGVSLNPSDTHNLNFGNWKTTQVSIDIDRGSKGQISERQPVPTAPVPTPVP